MEGKKRRKLKTGPFIIFCCLLVLVLGVGYVLANQFLFSGNGFAGSGGGAKKVALEGRTNFLLMGIDAREGETNTRTDTIMLVSVDKERNRIAMLSLPRDTRVRIPGQGYEKINSANVYGGPELVMKTVSDLVGVEIDNYLMTNVRGFRDIVDTLGGVTLDVEKRMYHYDPYDEPELRKIDLQPGLQRLDGNKALQYVRFRSDLLGDVTRTERQQKFLKALAKEMMQPATITKLPRLIPTINKYLETNLGLSDMVTLARAAQDLNNVEIVTQTMPGKFLNMDGVSYWSIDPEQARQVAQSMIEEGKAFDVVLGEENINTSKATPETKVKQPVNNEAVKEAESKIGQKDTGSEPPDSNVQIIVKPPDTTGGEQPNTGSGTTQTPAAPESGKPEEGANSGSGSWLPSQPL